MTDLQPFSRKTFRELLNRARIEMILYDWTRVLSSVVEELRMFGLDDELELPLALPHALTVSSFLLIRSRSLFLWGSAHSQDKTSKESKIFI